jgi:hypothetical protein
MAGAFVQNAARQAHTRAAFAQNATRGTVSAATGYFAPVQAVAPRFSHHETLSIAHGLADCAHATLLSLRKKVRDAPADVSPGLILPKSAGLNLTCCAHRGWWISRREIAPEVGGRFLISRAVRLCIGKCCHKLFRPESRNRYHQRYCAAPRCRAESKAASQARWLAAPERDYFRGPVNLARAWRSRNPGYWRKSRRTRVAFTRSLIGTSCFFETIPSAPSWHAWASTVRPSSPMYSLSRMSGSVSRSRAPSATSTFALGTDSGYALGAASAFGLGASVTFALDPVRSVIFRSPGSLT